jgi:hypothetical protein
MRCGQGRRDQGSKSCITSERNAPRGGIVWAGKNSIINAIKSLPSLLTVNHADSDILSLETLRAELPVCQISVH